MSSLVYGIVTAKRTAAPAGQSQTTAAPGIGTYVDALAALVPAEALAVYAGVVIPYSTKTVSALGKNVTVISDPSLLEWSCAGLLALSSLLYLVGRQQVPFNPSDVLRLFIPPMAFTAWMLVQNPGVWDLWWPGSVIGERTVIAAFAAVVLGVAASLLGQQADATPGTLAVTGVSPEEGSVAGGDNVTVTGSGLSQATVVKFGDVAAPKFHSVNDAQLTVTSPQATAPGIVDVTVTTSPGTSAGAQFTYEAAAAAPAVMRVSPEVAAAPAVTDVSPETGAVTGGTHVTLSGSGLTHATDVKFGQAPAQILAVTSDTELTVTSPKAAAPGPVDVTVTTLAGTSAAARFTYEPAAVAPAATDVSPETAAAPAVTDVSPETGAVTGGTHVTLSGSGLTHATDVKFGQAPAQNLAVTSDTELTVTSPRAANPGPVDVTVTTPAGTSAAARFIYLSHM